MARKISKIQMICIVLLWAALMFIVLISAERIDGPTIVTLLLASAFIFLPIYKQKQRKP